MDIARNEPILTRCCQTIFCRSCMMKHFASGVGNNSNDSRCPMCKEGIKGYRRYFRDSHFEWLQDSVNWLLELVKCVEAKVRFTVLTQVSSGGVCKPFRTALSLESDNKIWDEILSSSSHSPLSHQVTVYVPSRLFRSVGREKHRFPWLNLKLMRHAVELEGDRSFYMVDEDGSGRIYRSTSYFEALATGLTIISIKCTHTQSLIFLPAYKYVYRVVPVYP